MGRISLWQNTIDPLPGSPAIHTLRHRPGRPTVIDAPHTKDRLPIRHQQSRRMPLINLFRALRDYDLPLGLTGQINQGQIRPLAMTDKRREKEREVEKGKGAKAHEIFIAYPPRFENRSVFKPNLHTLENRLRFILGGIGQLHFELESKALGQ